MDTYKELVRLMQHCHDHGNPEACALAAHRINDGQPFSDALVDGCAITVQAIKDSGDDDVLR